MPVEVLRTYLEMSDESGLVAAERPDPRARVERMEGCPASFFRYLYVEVGRDYHWVDRLSWTDDAVKSYLADPTVSIWLLTFAGAPAGYFELKRHEDASTEIAYFGLLPEFIGQRLGSFLLHWSIKRAWVPGPDRVWVHTCSLDHPRALETYVSAGFHEYKRETSNIPDPRSLMDDD